VFRLAFNLIFVPQVIKILSKVKFCCCIMLEHLFFLFACVHKVVEFKFCLNSNRIG
jgi:hypothetical protein